MKCVTLFACVLIAQAMFAKAQLDMNTLMMMQMMGAGSGSSSGSSGGAGAASGYGVDLSSLIGGSGSSGSSASSSSGYPSAAMAALSGGAGSSSMEAGSSSRSNPGLGASRIAQMIAARGRGGGAGMMMPPGLMGNRRGMFSALGSQGLAMAGMRGMSMSEMMELTGCMQFMAQMIPNRMMRLIHCGRNV